MARSVTAGDAESPEEVPQGPDNPAVEAVPATLVDADTAAELAQAFKVLSDPTRVRLISALAAGEMCVADLARVVGISQSAASHQLRLLRNLQLVDYRRAGKAVYYSLDNHTLALFQQGLAHIGQ